MTTDSATAGRTRRAPVVPPQHGAWAFLGLPLAVAFTVTSWTPVLVTLSVAWIAAYPASYFVLAIAQDFSRRRPDPGRFVPPLLFWSAVAATAGLATAVLRPWLVWVALAYAVAFGVNLAYARRREDRALTNDAVFVAECALVVPVTWAVSVGEQSWTLPDVSSVPAHVWVLTVAVALVLTGSTLQVKSLIRERADPRYRVAAQAFAVASAVAALGLAAWWGLPSGLWLLLPFAAGVARAYVARDRGSRPGRIGMVELLVFVLLVVAAQLAGW